MAVPAQWRHQSGDLVPEELQQREVHGGLSIDVSWTKGSGIREPKIVTPSRGGAHEAVHA